MHWSLIDKLRVKLAWAIHPRSKELLRDEIDKMDGEELDEVDSGRRANHLRNVAGLQDEYGKKL